jgi:uncharacterized membrane protein
MSSDNEKQEEISGIDLNTNSSTDEQISKHERDEINYQDAFIIDDITSDDRLWAALGYPIPLIALIAILMDDKNERPFIRYHAVQAIVFSVVLWTAILLLGIVTLGIGTMCSPVLWLISLWPAYDAYQGNYTELPVITNFIKNRGWVS